MRFVFAFKPIISIHAPHARSDFLYIISSFTAYDFNPRSSCEERLDMAFIGTLSFVISIHAPHARSDDVVLFCQQEILISIHAPHARSDFHNELVALPKAISIHAPHARSDRFLLYFNTLPYYFNPRSSCEERLSGRSTTWSTLVHFNPRSSCEERLPNPYIFIRIIGVFQSTLLMRGATSRKNLC